MSADVASTVTAADVGHWLWYLFTSICLISLMIHRQRLISLCALAEKRAEEAEGRAHSAERAAAEVRTLFYDYVMKRNSES